MKKILLILLACLPLFAIAKDNKEKNNSDPKYLAGALTYEDGKIIASRSGDRQERAEKRDDIRRITENRPAVV